MTDKTSKPQPSSASKFSDFKSTESTGAARTPDESEQIEIRANAKQQLLRLASRAMNKTPAQESSSTTSSLPSIPGSPSAVAVADSVLKNKSLNENFTDAGET